MAKFTAPELQLEQEHAARGKQRATTFVVNSVVAGIALVFAFVPWYEWTSAYLQQYHWYRYTVTPLMILVACISIFSMRIALQWDRAVLLRLGRFHALRGPGMYFLLPIVDRISRLVDMRIRATGFQAESTLTKDTVPVNVDAICFWLVWDAKKAVLEVESFYKAITLSAQTALRDSIGRHTLAEMLTERERLGRALQEVLDAKTNAWGITVQSVEIRDVIIPQALEDAMSKQAQAERERQARIILSTAETEIAAKFVEAAAPYVNNPVAVHLRAMNMLYEGLKEKGSIIVVPSTAVETMNLGAIGGIASLGGNMQGKALPPSGAPVSGPTT